jgi:hypothetical protein
MYFITTKRMLEVCFSAHPNIQYRTENVNRTFLTSFRIPSMPQNRVECLDFPPAIVYSNGVRA